MTWYSMDQLATHLDCVAHEAFDALVNTRQNTPFSARPGPVQALRHLIELLAKDSYNPPLAAGEVITTGTLTKAMPVAAGETWTATPRGIALEPITLRFV